MKKIIETLCASLLMATLASLFTMCGNNHYGKQDEGHYNTNSAEIEMWHNMNSCKEDKMYSQYELATECLFEQANFFDTAEALKWYLKTAKEGDCHSQMVLGDMYFDGTYVERNFDEGVRWYAKAANQGCLKAQSDLGQIYQNGYYVRQNNYVAIKYFTKAAKKGDASAQYRLGIAYLYGFGVKEDYGKALKWLMKAAEQDYKMAFWELSWMYEQGLGVTKDSVEAELLCRKADIQPL